MDEPNLKAQFGQESWFKNRVKPYTISEIMDGYLIHEMGETGLLFVPKEAFQAKALPEILPKFANSEGILIIALGKIKAAVDEAIKALP